MKLFAAILALGACVLQVQSKSIFGDVDSGLLFEKISQSKAAQIVRFKDDGTVPASWKEGKNPNGYRPVVQMHGMGDFAENPLGMIPLKKKIAQLLDGAYVTNIALAKNPIADSLNTFLMVMWEEVDTFAAAVQSDPKLANGFNAIGYSQGNLIIRGYIEKYNNPPVFNYVSVHGVMAGVAGFPHCDYGSKICDMFDKLLGDLVYMDIAQKHLAQANYFRDPLRIPAFIKGSEFLPDVNNERSPNATYTSNFAKLEKLALVKALNDTMVVPNDSEWFDFFVDGTSISKNQKWGFKNTPWYKKDMFGLQTLDNAQKITFLTTPGDHLQFTMQDLEGYVNTYFKN